MGRKNNPKKVFTHEQNAEFHRRNYAIVARYVGYLRGVCNEFEYSRKELIDALYDTLFAANQQLNYRDYIHSRNEQEKAARLTDSPDTFDTRFLWPDLKPKK